MNDKFLISHLSLLRFVTLLKEEDRYQVQDIKHRKMKPAKLLRLSIVEIP